MEAAARERGIDVRHPGQELVERMAEPAFLVDLGGEVVCANEPGLVVLRSERVAAFEANRRSELRTKVAACLTHGPQEMLARCERWVLIVFLVDRLQSSMRHVVVRMIDPRMGPRASSATLRRLYRLTEAEAALAEQIGRGLTPKEAASELSVAVSTVRTQLRSVFSKTGTDRQVTLIRLLERLSAIRRE